MFLIHLLGRIERSLLPHVSVHQPVQVSGVGRQAVRHAGFVLGTHQPVQVSGVGRQAVRHAGFVLGTHQPVQVSGVGRQAVRHAGFVLGTFGVGSGSFRL